MNPQNLAAAAGASTASGVTVSTATNLLQALGGVVDQVGTAALPLLQSEAATLIPKLTTDPAIAGLLTSGLTALTTQAKAGLTALGTASKPASS